MIHFRLRNSLESSEIADPIVLRDVSRFDSAIFMIEL
jgi:hypothetical protein